MEFLTLEAADYESALKEARAKYGSSVRIHTRKDISKPALLGRKEKRCVITFYLVDTGGLESSQEIFDPVACLKELAVANDLPPALFEPLLGSLGPDASRSQVEVELLRTLLEGLRFEEQPSCRYLVYVGPAGVGKTTTVIKQALLLRTQGKRVAVMTFDTKRIGSLDQVRQLAQTFSLPLFEADEPGDLELHLDDLASFDHVLVDTSGISIRDAVLREHLDRMLTLLPEPQRALLLVASSTFKESDLASQLDLYGQKTLSAVVFTKLDETSGIGSLLSFLHASSLGLAFLTDGQTIPDDLHKASSQQLMRWLKGFELDLPSFFDTLKN